MFDRIRPPSCWTAETTQRVIDKEKVVDIVPRLPAKLKELLQARGILYISEFDEATRRTCDSDERLQTFFGFSVVVTGEHITSSLEFPVLSLQYDHTVMDGVGVDYASDKGNAYAVAKQRTLALHRPFTDDLSVCVSKVCRSVDQTQRSLCNGFDDSHVTQCVLLLCKSDHTRALMQTCNLSGVPCAEWLSSNGSSVEVTDEDDDIAQAFNALAKRNGRDILQEVEYNAFQLAGSAGTTRSDAKGSIGRHQVHQDSEEGIVGGLSVPGGGTLKDSRDPLLKSQLACGLVRCAIFGCLKVLAVGQDSCSCGARRLGQNKCDAAGCGRPYDPNMADFCLNVSCGAALPHNRQAYAQQMMFKSMAELNVPKAAEPKTKAERLMATANQRFAQLGRDRRHASSPFVTQHTKAERFLHKMLELSDQTSKMHHTEQLYFPDLRCEISYDLLYWTSQGSWGFLGKGVSIFLFLPPESNE